MIAIPRVRPTVNLVELSASEKNSGNALSLRASAFVWLMLSAASWGVVVSGARIVLG